ncbi:hypothetical protein HDU82_001164, partial [Entophlyctis luteolus]
KPRAGMNGDNHGSPLFRPPPSHAQPQLRPNLPLGQFAPPFRYGLVAAGPAAPGHFLQPAWISSPANNVSSSSSSASTSSSLSSSSAPAASELVARGGYPLPKNTKFLGRLGIRTIVSLTPHPPSFHHHNNSSNNLTPTSVKLASDSNAKDSSINDPVHAWVVANNITTVYFRVDAPTDDNEIPLSFKQASNILAYLINPSLMPIYVHCLDGGVVTGLVCALLRKMMCWSAKSAIAEYSRFMAGEEIDGTGVHEFVDRFSGEIEIPPTIPTWLWNGQIPTKKHPTVRLKLPSAQQQQQSTASAQTTAPLASTPHTPDIQHSSAQSPKLLHVTRQQTQTSASAGFAGRDSVVSAGLTANPLIASTSLQSDAISQRARGAVQPAHLLSYGVTGASPATVFATVNNPPADTVNSESTNTTALAASSSLSKGATDQRSDRTQQQRFSFLSQAEVKGSPASVMQNISTLAGAGLNSDTSTAGHGIIFADSAGTDESTFTADAGQQGVGAESGAVPGIGNGIGLSMGSGPGAIATQARAPTSAARVSRPGTAKNQLLGKKGSGVVENLEISVTLDALDLEM